MPTLEEEIERVRQAEARRRERQETAGFRRPQPLTEEAIYEAARRRQISERAADKLIAGMRRAKAMLASGGREAVQLRLDHEIDDARKRYADRKLTEWFDLARIAPAHRELSLQDPSLDIDEGNRRAVELLRRFEAEWQPGMKGLTLEGPPGCGKTHLVTAAVLGVMRRIGIQRRTVVVTEADLQRFVQAAQTRRSDDWQTPSHVQLREWYIVRPDILVIDDLGAVRNPDFRAMTFLVELVDHRSAAKKTTLVTTNLTAEQITARHDERFASRLYSRSPRIGVNGPDRRQTTLPDDDDPFWDPDFDSQTGAPRTAH
jgi:DNA replication protein DnaC